MMNSVSEWTPTLIKHGNILVNEAKSVTTCRSTAVWKQTGSTNIVLGNEKGFRLTHVVCVTVLQNIQRLNSHSDQAGIPAPFCAIAKIAWTSHFWSPVLRDNLNSSTDSLNRPVNLTSVVNLTICLWCACTSHQLIFSVRCNCIFPNTRILCRDLLLCSQ